MQNCPQIKNVKILSASITMLDFYEHLQFQQCCAVIMKSEHSRKHRIIFVHCFNISRVFKEYDFNNIIKMNTFTTAKKKRPTSTKWKAKLRVHVFFCWKCDGNWSISETRFCFNRIIFLCRWNNEKKKMFFLIIDQTYSPEPQITLLEIAEGRGEVRWGGWSSRRQEPAETGFELCARLIVPWQLRWLQ